MAYGFGTIEGYFDPKEELNPLLRRQWLPIEEEEAFLRGREEQEVNPHWTEAYREEAEAAPLSTSLAPEALPVFPEQPLTELPPGFEKVSGPPEEGMTELPEGFEKQPWFTKLKDDIDPKEFDTPLTPAEEANFERWKEEKKPVETEETYDLRGAFKWGIDPDEEGKLPNRWAKPSHPFFSTESRYAEGAEERLAGHYDKEGNFIEPEEPEAPGYVREAVSRFGRATTTAVMQTVRGVLGSLEMATDGGNNPYLWISKEEATKDVPELQAKFDAANEKLQRLGAVDWQTLNPQERAVRTQEVFTLNKEATRLKNLRDWAEEASTGHPTQGFVGDVSEGASAIGDAVKGWQRTADKWWGKEITEARNSDAVMEFVEGIGHTTPQLSIATVASKVPVIGQVFSYGAMYFQTVGAKLDEMEKRAKDMGIPYDEDRALKIANAHAFGNTPWEWAGEAFLGNRIAKMFGAVPLKILKDKKAFGQFLGKGAVDLTKSLGGEVGITTPGQFLTEQYINEAYGITEPPATFFERFQRLA